VPYRSVNPASGEVSFPTLALKEFVNRKLIFVPNGHLGG
jgi:hypothetical protein